MTTISELYIYPIKSLGGISVSEVIVEPRGFRHDRRYMVVAPDGTFMTQRTNHQMALIDVAIVDETLRIWHRNRPDDVLELPLQPTESDLANNATLLVDIWDSKGVRAVSVSERADQWFTNVLEKPCRLVFMPENSHRPVDADYAQDLENDVVSFADGYPYLLIGQASLDYLNQRATEHMTMLRFRPNIVVSGSEPYDEDAWAHFQIGDLAFYGVKPCARCVLTTINPETAKLGKEPLKTLATYRQWKHKILFGQNVLPKQTEAFPLGYLRVGQAINVLRRQEPWLAAPDSVEVGKK